MRVMLITADYPPNLGGVARLGGTLATILASNGHAVTVITSVADTTGVRDDRVRIVRTPAFLNRKLLKLMPLFIASLWHALRQRPDLLVLAKATHEGAVGLFLSTIIRLPYVALSYGTELLQAEARPLRSAFTKTVFRRARVIIAISNFTRCALARLNIPSEKIVVVYPPVERPRTNALSVDEIARIYGLEQKRVILTVGRLVPRKGHDDVIRAVGVLKDRYPDLVYVVAGAGEFGAHLRRLAADLGVAERVYFLGRVPDVAIDGLYRACEVFALPGRQHGTDVEGFGIVFIEAALRGKPVIAGRSGAIEEVVDHEITGLVVRPGVVDELVEAVVRLLDDGELRNRLGRQAEAKALNAFTFESQGAELLGVLARAAR